MKSEKFEVKDILKRAKLLMEYDTSKTLDENLSIKSTTLDSSTFIKKLL